MHKCRAPFRKLGQQRLLGNPHELHVGLEVHSQKFRHGQSLGTHGGRRANGGQGRGVVRLSGGGQRLGPPAPAATSCMAAHASRRQRRASRRREDRAGGQWLQFFTIGAWAATLLG